ncbi:MAG: hypothetical protein ACOYXB_10600 [Bacteroidota bacterium]
MKKLFYLLPGLLLSAGLFITGCDSKVVPEPENSILPEKFSIDIPSSISRDAGTTKSAQIDTLKGNEIYQHLTFFIRVGEAGAEVVEHVIAAINVYHIDQIKTLTFESDDDGRIKNMVVTALPLFEDRTWEYGLTITDSDSEGEADGGKAIQIFWNNSPREGIAILKPYNIDRGRNSDKPEAMYRVDYSEAGEMGYDAHMIVSVAGLPSVDPLLAPFAMDGMKMFVGKKGDFIDVYGNSSHPNAKFLSSVTGYNWAFVASGSESMDIAVAEVGLPLNTLDATGREVLLEEYSVRNVLTNEVLTVWPNASQDLIDAWLTNTEAPGFFDDHGFVQGGTAPGEEYNDLTGRIPGLAPYNPKVISSLEIAFN